MKKYILSAVALTAFIGGIGANAMEIEMAKCFTQQKEKTSVTYCYGAGNVPAEIARTAVHKTDCGFKFDEANKMVIIECKK